MMFLPNPFIYADHVVLCNEVCCDMTQNRKPLLVREDDVRAYELRTGFVGFGDFLEQSGEIVVLRGNHGNS